ncbi:MAG: ArsI/CadI family heavy metal resistance metalloenzyme [Actinomycetales bacterium]
MARVQLALNVCDLEASVAFYSTLFGVSPHKRRPGYANFEVSEPPLKLVLFEVSPQERGTGPDHALNHLGVELDSAAEVATARKRVVAAGLATFDEDDTVCCHARQTKTWVSDPAGARWEFYTITDDEPDQNPGYAPAQDSSTEPVAVETACCT